MYRDTQKNSDTLQSTCEILKKYILMPFYCIKPSECNIGFVEAQKHDSYRNGGRRINIMHEKLHKIIQTHYWLWEEIPENVFSDVSWNCTKF